MKSPKIHRTAKYRAKAAFQNMKRRCTNTCGDNPAYRDVELRMTEDEWMSWAIPRYQKFIDDNPGLSPSVSRFGDSGHYEISNVEIISKIENRLKQKQPSIAVDDLKRCSRCKMTKSVLCFVKNRARPDGLHHYCNDCKKLVSVRKI